TNTKPMANTYKQIHIHAVFAVQNRKSLIFNQWEENLHKVITTILQEYGHKMLQINGIPYHVHIIFGMRPTQSLWDLMRYVQQSSPTCINDERLVGGKFSWQEGYGAFSYAKTQIPQVIRYISNIKTSITKRKHFNKNTLNYWMS